MLTSIDNEDWDPGYGKKSDSCDAVTLLQQQPVKHYNL